MVVKTTDRWTGTCSRLALPGTSARLVRRLSFLLNCVCVSTHLAVFRGALTGVSFSLTVCPCVLAFVRDAPSQAQPGRLAESPTIRNLETYCHLLPAFVLLIYGSAVQPIQTHGVHECPGGDEWGPEVPQSRRPSLHTYPLIISSFSETSETLLPFDE